MSVYDDLTEKVRILSRQLSRVQRLETELESARAEIRELRRTRGKFGRGCKVESHFFGTDLKMGHLTAMFYWHNGKPAVKIRNGDRELLLDAVLTDNGLVPFCLCNNCIKTRSTAFDLECET